jgi:magnesium-transporting ATPase (P-type)
MNQAAHPFLRRPWHSLSADDALAALESNPRGLTQGEGRHRLEVHGPNRIRPARRRGPMERFLLQFHNVLIYILIAAGAVTAWLGHWVDSGVIFGVVIVNAIIGFVQEGKAEKALEAIRSLLSPRATVLRDGRRRDVPAEDLVPGDVVLLASGDKVPADLRLMECRNLRIEEAALTGESEPVEKSVAPVDAEAALGDRFCMAYSGTLVAYGQGSGVVVATGDSTEIGRISGMLAEVQEVATPLLRQLASFGRLLSAAILALAGATFAFGMIVHGFAAGEMFLAAVGLAVAAIPEGLPAIMTITLAIGVQRMARRNAIIRRLPAVETLGSVTVICSDKTGTLTQNEMTVKRVITSGRAYEVTGAGYEPRGGFAAHGAEVRADEDKDLFELLTAGVGCNDAGLRQADDGRWIIEGDPTVGALLTLGAKAGLDAQAEGERLPRLDTIPFESERRFMATLHHDHAGHALVYVKGAPEQVLGMCDRELSLGADRPLQGDYWSRHIDAAALAGMRVLALAVRPAEQGSRELTYRDVEGGLTLLGLVGIMDPPRPEAIAAVGRCRSAGIRVKMITGDHLATARAVGAQLGIGVGEEALSGVQLESMDDEALASRVRETDVYARASPEHKLRLVTAMQARGEVVAMTGDGVNDAPALKRADVGVAMGKKGTEAAKEAAEMVLADDNFASIAHAVEEGRTVYDNLKKAILFILPTNGGEAGVIVCAILLGLALPITPVQILWVNMITAVTLALALAFEPPERNVMRRRPRDPREPLLSGFLIWRIAFVSLLLAIGVMGLFLWEVGRGASLEEARTVSVNALVMGEIFYLFNSRYILASAFAREGLLGNHYALLAVAVLLAMQGLFTYWPPMQGLFGTAPLDLAAWWRVVSVGLMVFLLVEAEKALMRRRTVPL